MPKFKSPESSDDDSCGGKFASRNDPDSLSDDGGKYSLDQHGQVWIRYSQCFDWCHKVCDAAIDECVDKKHYYYCLNLYVYLIGINNFLHDFSPSVLTRT